MVHPDRLSSGNMCHSIYDGEQGAAAGMNYTVVCFTCSGRHPSFSASLQTRSIVLSDRTLSLVGAIGMNSFISGDCSSQSVMKRSTIQVVSFKIILCSLQ